MTDKITSNLAYKIGLCIIILITSIYFGYSITPPDACLFENNSDSVRIISDFVLNDSALTYSSGFMGIKYVDATKQSASLSSGGTYNYSIYAGIGYYPEFYYYFIFIDFNADGTFTTPGDTVAYISAKAFREHKGKIKIPINQKFGVYRMRLTNGPSLTTGVTTGCGDAGPFTQAVDFTINITKQISIDSLINPNTANDDVYCAGSAIKIQFKSFLQLDPQNTFSAEISDSNGNFIQPIIIGTLGEYKFGAHTLTGILPPSANGKNYKIRIVSSNPNFTSDTSNTFKIDPLPQPKIYGDTVLCSPTVSTYKTNPKPGISNLWSVEGGTISFGNNGDSVVVVWRSTPTGKVVLKQTNLLTNCSDSISKIITLNPTPVPKITGSQNVCQTYLTIYKSDPDTIQSFYNWSISPNGTVVGSTTDSIINVIWNSPGQGTIKLIKSYSSGCLDSVSIIVNINNDKPTPQILGNLIVCENATVHYQIDSILPGSTYQWKVQGGSIYSNSTIFETNVNWGSSGSGKVTLIEKNSSGCIDSITIDVTILAKPNAVIIGDSIVCETNFASYHTNISKGTLYKWKCTGGEIQGSDSTDAVLVKWDQSGKGFITLSLYNSVDCKDSSSLSINIMPLPKPIIIGRNIVCLNESLDFSANYDPNLMYNWTLDNSSIASINGVNDSPSINISFSNIGTVQLKLIQTNIQTACKDSVIFKLYCTNINIEMLSTNLICPGDSLEIKYNFSPLPDSVGNLLFQLVNTNGYPSYSFQIKYNGQSYPKIGIPSDIPSGTYKLKLLCQDYDYDLIIGLPAPNIAGIQNVCAKFLTSYSTITDPNLSYKWDITGGLIQGSSTSNQVNILWGKPGDGKIKLTITDKKGCTGYNIQPVKIYFKDLFIDGNSLICSGNQVNKYRINAPGAEKKWIIIGGEIQGDENKDEVTVKFSSVSSAKIICVLNIPGGNCKDSITLDINIDQTPLPEISIIGDSAVCENTIHDYSITSYPNFKIKWRSVGGTIQGSDSSDICKIIWGNKYDAMIIVDEILPSGCKTSDTLPVNISSYLSRIIGNENVCKNETSIYYTTHYDKITNKWKVTGGDIVNADNTDSLVINWQPSANLRIISLEQITSPENCRSTITKRVFVQNPMLIITLPDIVTDPSKSKGKTDTISMTATKVQCLSDLGVLPETADFYLKFKSSMFLPFTGNRVTFSDYSNQRQVKITVQMKDIKTDSTIFNILGNILLGDALETQITSDSTIWIDGFSNLKIIPGRIRLTNIPDIDGLRLLKSNLLLGKVYPNPGDGNLFLEITSYENIKTDLLLYDYLGNFLKKFILELNKGSNIINFNNQMFPSSGQYYFVIEGQYSMKSLFFNITK